MPELAHALAYLFDRHRIVFCTIRVTIRLSFWEPLDGCPGYADCHRREQLWL